MALRRTSLVGLPTLALVAGAGLSQLAMAADPPSLAGSNFEIESDANLKVDGAAPNIDWGNVRGAGP